MRKYEAVIHLTALVARGPDVTYTTFGPLATLSSLFGR
jgi:hypothetical protein